MPGVSCQASGGPKEQILNPAAFTLTGYQLGTIGDAGRGICHGPDYLQVDLSLYKNIRISNRVKAQLRFEVFNIFNNVNFRHAGGNWTYNATSATLRCPLGPGHHDRRGHARCELRSGHPDVRLEGVPVRDQALLLSLRA